MTPAPGMIAGVRRVMMMCTRTVRADAVRFVARFDPIEGVNGFDSGRRAKGSVPVQAGDHRKRRRKRISADKSQREFALAA